MLDFGLQSSAITPYANSLSGSGRVSKKPNNGGLFAQSS